MDVDELQHALGGIVPEWAYLERILRTAFSALVGSKYAAVIGGRLTASSLIDCDHLTTHHTGIPGPAREALRKALRPCREANRERNRVVHDAWATRPGNVMVTLRGDRQSHDVTVSVRTLAEVRQLADRVGQAADELKAAMHSALDPGWVLTEDELRQELGHDVNVDPGSQLPRQRREAPGPWPRGHFR